MLEVLEGAVWALVEAKRDGISKAKERVEKMLKNYITSLQHAGNSVIYDDYRESFEKLLKILDNEFNKHKGGSSDGG